MLNQGYRNPGTIAQIRKAFVQNKALPSITLQQCFDDETCAGLSKAIKSSRFQKKVDKMHYRYGIAKTPIMLKKILESEEFIDFCSFILGEKIRTIEGEIHSFGWRDYTLLHDDAVAKPGFDLIIDFTESWQEGAGGTIVYVDGTGTYQSIPSSSNALSLTERKEGVQKFVQYVNHNAGKQKRALFLGSLRR